MYYCYSAELGDFLDRSLLLEYIYRGRGEDIELSIPACMYVRELLSYELDANVGLDSE